MYIDTINSVVTAGNVSTVKMTAPTPETDNAVRVESMEGEAQKNKGINATIMDFPKNDTKMSDDTQASDNERIRKTIEKINAQLPNSEVKFGIHEKTDRVTIKLVDKETKEVIKEFPPEKTLDMIAKCMELAGVLVDQKL